jgi:hypothetical protein
MLASSRDRREGSITASRRGIIFALLMLCAVLSLAGTDLILPAVPALPAIFATGEATSQLVLASYVAGTALALRGVGRSPDPANPGCILARCVCDRIGGLRPVTEYLDLDRAALCSGDRIGGRTRLRARHYQTDLQRKGRCSCHWLSRQRRVPRSCPSAHPRRLPPRQVRVAKLIRGPWSRGNCHGSADLCAGVAGTAESGGSAGQLPCAPPGPGVHAVCAVTGDDIGRPGCLCLRRPGRDRRDHGRHPA